MSFAPYETSLAPLDKIWNFIKKSEFPGKNFPATKFQILKSAGIGHEIMLSCLFHLQWAPNPHICKMQTLKPCSCWYFQYFLQKCHFSEMYYIPSGTRSSSRGVLTIRKVLPSKSMKSQLSNAPSNVLLAILDQKSSRFEVQN